MKEQITLVEFYEKYLVIKTDKGDVKPPPLVYWQRDLLEMLENYDPKIRHRFIPIRTRNYGMNILIKTLDEYKKFNTK